MSKQRITGERLKELACYSFGEHSLAESQSDVCNEISLVIIV